MIGFRETLRWDINLHTKIDLSVRESNMNSKYTLGDLGEYSSIPNNHAFECEEQV